MAAIRGSNQGLQITQRYLNTASYAGDPTPGAVVSTSQVSGSIVQPYSGQYGTIITLSMDDANYYTDPVNGQQLYAGDYQYVHFDPNMIAAAAVQGQVVFWSEQTAGNLLSDKCRVSADYNVQYVPAGIALTNTAKGNWWFIQTAGIAQVKFGGTQYSATPSVGDLIFADYNSSTIYAYDPEQSLSPTSAEFRQVLGTAWTAPVANAISPVFIQPRYYPGQAAGGQ